MNMSQVVESGQAADIRVWSNWVNLPVSDSYELALFDALDCEGAFVDDINEIGRFSARLQSTGVSGSFTDSPNLSGLGSYSIELSGQIGAEFTSFGCCNIEVIGQPNGGGSGESGE